MGFQHIFVKNDEQGLTRVKLPNCRYPTNWRSLKFFFPMIEQKPVLALPILQALVAFAPSFFFVYYFHFSFPCSQFY